jgi:hypothetical protein
MAAPDRATGMMITDDLSKIMGRPVPDAQVFLTLTRMRDRGLIEIIEPVSDDTGVTQTVGEAETSNDQSGECSGLLAQSPSKRSRSRNRKRAAHFKLTPQGVRAVEASAALISLSTSPSIDGDEHEFNAKSRTSAEMG